MIPIPQPVKKIFDTFPLQTYPAEVNHVDLTNRYYFQGKAQVDSKFTLGVHNVIQYKDKFIPSDPVSLGQALILAEKNSLKLPVERAEKNTVTSSNSPVLGGTTESSPCASSNSILVLAYQASPDNQLPILIEDVKQSRNTILLNSINKSVSSKLVIDDLIFNGLIDDKFSDIWILSLLTEVSEETLIQIFNLDETINKLELFELYGEIPNWKSFKIRFPYLFESQYKKLLWKSERLGRFYDTQLKSFKKDLELLIELFSENDKVLQLKLVGYVVAIDMLLKGTKLWEVVQEYPEFVKLSYEVLDRC